MRKSTRVAWFGLGVVLAAAALAIATWWWRHPTLFLPTGGTIGSERVPIGRPIHVGVVGLRAGDSATVTIDQVVAQVSQNSADASISFSVCSDPDGVPIGIANGRLDRWCGQIDPVEKAELTTGEGHFDQVVITIVPARAGAVEIDGVELTYSYGWQRGSQLTGPHLRLVARPEPRRRA